MADQFREAEATFSRLRERFRDKQISQEEFSDSLKQLRIKDDDGRFWVLGAQSGRWYVHERGQWIEAKAPSQMERKAICIACGFENDLEAETCARCGSRADEDAPSAPAGADGEGLPAPGEAAASSASGEIVVRSLDLRSFFWFFGVFGFFSGILVGLLAGATGLFGGLVDRLPAFFVEHRGDLLGGISCSVVGGVLGFGGGGAAGLLLAAVSNGILSLVGGLRFRRS
jgi:ribosomal protein L40E